MLLCGGSTCAAAAPPSAADAKGCALCVNVGAELPHVALTWTLEALRQPALPEQVRPGVAHDGDEVHLHGRARDVVNDASRSYGSADAAMLITGIIQGGHGGILWYGHIAGTAESCDARWP